jgi:hypothetical protein
MNYELAFWILLTINVTAFLCKTTVYIGSDEKKYEASDFGILLRK